MPIIDARYYKTLLICPSKSLAAEVGPYISHGLPLAPVQLVADYPTRRPLVDLLQKFDPKICFVDFTTNKDFAFGFVTEVQAIKSAVAIVALLPSNDSDLVLRCLRHGATDFLIRPFTHDQIDAAVEKIARVMPAPNQRHAGGGKLIGVFPAKGACGATTIACNLAYQSKRVGAKKILLADLDPMTGTVSFLLKLKSTYSFLDAISRQSTLDADLWKQMALPSQGVDVLLAPENLVDGIDELQDASPITEYARRVYETIVIDCGNAYTDWNLSIARNCDELLLVTTNELASLQAAQKSLAHFQQHHIDSSTVRIIVNRYDRDIGLNAEIIGDALNTEVFQIVPSDYEAVQRSLMDGKPIPANSSIGKSLAQLADKVCKPHDRGGDDKKQSSSVGGLFSRLSRASS
jgi:pilus assembly protein CpaE